MLCGVECFFFFCRGHRRPHLSPLSFILRQIHRLLQGSDLLRVPQFSPPVKCSLGGNPVAPSSQRPRKPYPTPPPSIMPQLLTASMELISQMRFLSWSMICFSCWFFCLSFCKERKRGQSATTSMTSAKLSERRYSRQGRNYSLYLVDKIFKSPPTSPRHFFTIVR